MFVGVAEHGQAALSHIVLTGDGIGGFAGFAEAREQQADEDDDDADDDHQFYETEGARMRGFLVGYRIYRYMSAGAGFGPKNPAIFLAREAVFSGVGGFIGRAEERRPGRYR